MFDIGWSEIALIVVVALIVIGPKDLPKVLKTIGIWVRKARMLTRDFQNSVDEMIREADMEDVRRQATELRNINIGREVEKTIDPSGSLRDAFDPNITARPRADGAGGQRMEQAGPVGPAGTSGTPNRPRPNCPSPRGTAGASCTRRPEDPGTGIGTGRFT